MIFPVRTAFIVGCLAWLAGCASSSSPSVATGAVAGAAARPEASGYALSPDELKLDCRKLTGRMQVRLVQLRGYSADKQSSLVSRTMQKVAKPVLGGTSAGADPDQRYADDVAVLRAYNARLAELKCATYDLDKELAAKPGDPTPQPVPLPTGKAKRSP